MLGTNGGGFFNANSAHPFENRPRCRIFWRFFRSHYSGGADVHAGRMTDRRGTAGVFGAMYVLFAVGFIFCYWRSRSRIR